MKSAFTHEQVPDPLDVKTEEAIDASVDMVSNKVVYSRICVATFHTNQVVYQRKSLRVIAYTTLHILLSFLDYEYLINSHHSNRSCHHEPLYWTIIMLL